MATQIIRWGRFIILEWKYLGRKEIGTFVCSVVLCEKRMTIKEIPLLTDSVDFWNFWIG